MSVASPAASSSSANTAGPAAMNATDERGSGSDDAASPSDHFSLLSSLSNTVQGDVTDDQAVNRAASPLFTPTSPARAPRLHYQVEDDDIPVIIDVPSVTGASDYEIPSIDAARPRDPSQRGFRGLTKRMLAFFGHGAGNQDRKALVSLVWTLSFNFAQVRAVATIRPVACSSMG